MVRVPALAPPRTPRVGSPSVGAMTAAAAALAVVLALADWVGVSEGILIGFAVAGSLAGYGLLALAGASSQPADHLVAGRAMTAPANGVTIAALWVSGFLYLGLPGLLAAGGAAIALPAAWAIGLALMGALMAPFVHKSGAQSVPDFLGRRYRGVMPRLFGFGLVAVICTGLLIAQMQATGLLFAWLLGARLPVLAYDIGVWIAAAGVLLCAVPGGMASCSRVQVAQAAVLALGLAVPIVWLVSDLASGLGTPQGAGAAVAAAATRLPELSGLALADAAGLALTVALGTAAMPHLLTRTLTTSTVAAARSSVLWGLLAVVLVLLVVPVQTVLVDLMVGQLFDLGGGVRPLDGIPGWLQGGPEGSATICGGPATDLAAVRAACGADRLESGFSAADVTVAPQTLGLFALDLAAMPATMTALVAAGGLAAALSTGCALAATLGGSVAHDLADRLLEAEMRPAQKAMVARGAGAVATVLAAGLASAPRTDVWDLLGWTLSLGASGLFAALVLGIWDRRTTGPGAAAGMLAGFVVAVVCIGWGVFGPDGLRGTGDEAPWLELDPRAASVFGVPVAFAVTWAVSRLTPPPDEATRDFIDEMRIPRGSAIGHLG